MCRSRLCSEGIPSAEFAKNILAFQHQESISTYRDKSSNIFAHSSKKYVRLAKDSVMCTLTQ